MEKTKKIVNEQLEDFRRRKTAKEREEREEGIQIRKQAEQYEKEAIEDALREKQKNAAMKQLQKTYLEAQLVCQLPFQIFSGKVFSVY